MAKTSIMNKTPRLSDEEVGALRTKLISAVRSKRLTILAMVAVTRDDDLTIESIEEDVAYMGAAIITECLIAAGEMADPSDPQLDPLEKMIDDLEFFARKALQHAATPAQIKYLAKLAVDTGATAEGLTTGGALSGRQASFMIGVLKAEA